MRDEKELGKALKEKRDTIEIEGDLVRKVFKIKITGKVAWGVCIAAITVAVTWMLTGGVAMPVSNIAALPVLAAPIGVLGTGTTVSAVAIAVAAGGVGALNLLRDYDIEKISDTKAILHKR
ncbi:MAG: hypothetical protein UFJ18_16240 [Blautia sp.]|nr:hypothetical protein [Blautia sp.]